MTDLGHHPAVDYHHFEPERQPVICTMCEEEWPCRHVQITRLKEEIATLRPLVEWLAMSQVKIYATDHDAFDLKAYIKMPVGKVREARRALGLPPDEIGEPSLSERKER